MERIKFKDVEVGGTFWFEGMEWKKKSESEGVNKYHEGGKTKFNPDDVVKVVG